MRIALVGPYPTDVTRIPGGVSAVVCYLADALQSIDDIELHVVSTTKEAGCPGMVRVGESFVHYVQEPSRKLIPNMITNIGRVRACLEDLNPDVVHSHGAVGALASAGAGFPTVYTIHGIIHQELRLATSISAKLNMGLLDILTKKAVPKAQRIIAISRYVESEYAKWITGEVHHIPNPVDDKFFDITAREVATKMLYAGVISDRKNVVGLVKAFHLVHKQNPDAQLFICGKVVQQEQERLARDYIKTHDLADAVHMLGFISQEELLQHFAEAAVICLFSYEETAPVLIGQAMACGKPVVASCAGGTPDMVDDGETGYVVDVDDCQAFAERSLELLADADLRSRMGRRARDVADQRFRRYAIAEQTASVYRDLVLEKPE